MRGHDDMARTRLIASLAANACRNKMRLVLASRRPRQWIVPNIAKRAHSNESRNARPAHAQRAPRNTIGAHRFRRRRGIRIAFERSRSFTARRPLSRRAFLYESRFFWFRHRESSLPTKTRASSPLCAKGRLRGSIGEKKRIERAGRSRRLGDRGGRLADPLLFNNASLPAIEKPGRFACDERGLTGMRPTRLLVFRTWRMRATP